MVLLAVLSAALLHARREAARWRLEVRPHASAVTAVQERRLRLLAARGWTYQARASAAELAAHHAAELAREGWREVAENRFTRGDRRLELAVRDADGLRRVSLVMTLASGTEREADRLSQRGD